MSKNTKQRVIYFRLEDKLVQKLDRRIERIGYNSRSDFFAAVAYVTLYGDKTENQPLNGGKMETVSNIPENVKTWLRKTTPRISEDEILSGLHEIIEDMLLPVIAMKGVDIAYEHTWEDVRTAFHEKSGVWVTESDVREAYASFAAIHKAKLAQYRERQIMEGAELRE